MQSIEWMNLYCTWPESKTRQKKSIDGWIYIDCELGWHWQRQNLITTMVKGTYMLTTWRRKKRKQSDKHNKDQIDNHPVALYLVPPCLWPYIDTSRSLFKTAQVEYFLYLQIHLSHSSSPSLLHPPSSHSHWPQQAASKQKYSTIVVRLQIRQSSYQLPQA